MMVWHIFFTAPLAVYLTFQDCRTQFIPLLGLLAWVIVHAAIAYVGTPSYEVFTILGILSLCICFFQICIKKMYVGIADLIVMISFSSWMTIDQLPLFFMLCGGLGIMTAIITKSKRFPFMPALFLSALIIFLLSN